MSKASVIFGENLTRELKRKGWTQGRLAKECSLSSDSVSYYCSGRSLPRPERVAEIAAALGVEAAVLRGEKRGTLNTTGGFGIEAKGENFVHMKIDQDISWSTAMKIMELLKNDKLDG